MHDLDKRIAELKGYDLVVMDQTRAERPDFPENGEFFRWSTSDAKAFELVDELNTQFFIERFGNPIIWAAVFLYRNNALHEKDFRSEGKTRAEAICRAYIAAKEWMATKAGA